MSYCTRQDLIDRLGEAGLLFVADDDADETASETERAASLDRAIASADAEIDAALAPHGPVPTSGNVWLRERAVDLAVERLAERRGAQAPASIAAGARRTREWLEMVRKGTLRPPGLAYPDDARYREVRGAGMPRLANPEVDS